MLGTFAAAAALAQPRFERRFGLDSFDVRARAIQETADGGFIIAGTATVYDTTDQVMPTRGLLLRIDAAGEPLWWRLYGSSRYNEFSDVHPMSDGGFLVCGFSDGTSVGRRGYKDAWLVRTNALGDTIWSRQYGTNGDDEFSGMMPVANARLLLYGSLENNARGALMCLDTAGSVVWSRDQPAIRAVYGVAPARDGYWLVGWPGGIVVRTDSVGRTRWDSAYARYSSVRAGIPTDDGGLVIWGVSNDLFNPILASIDSIGRWRWSRGFSFPRLHDGNPPILRTADGGYVFVSHEAVGNDQPLVIKTDCVGKELWRRVYDNDSALHESGYTAMAIASNGDIVMAGYYYLAYRLAPPGQLAYARVDSAGYVVRPDADPFWSHALYTGETCSGLTVDSSGTILVGESSNTGRTLLLRSTDGGITWAHNGGPGYRYNSLTTASDGTIYGVRATDWGLPAADSTQGLWRSTDRGAGWTRVAALPSVNVASVTSAADGQLYVLGYGVLWRSSDRGSSWDSVVVPTTVRDMAVASGGQLVLANDSLGLLLSNDRGSTWRSAEPVPSGRGPRARLFTVVARGDGDVFALTISNDSAFHTSDDGATWRRIDSAARLRIGALAHVRGALYAQASDGTWRSLDDGATWQRVSDTAFGIARFAVDRTGRLVGAGRGIFVSHESTVGLDDAPLPTLLDLSALDAALRREREVERTNDH